MSPGLPADKCLRTIGESTRSRVVKGCDRLSNKRGSGESQAVEDGLGVRRPAGDRVARVRAASVQPSCGDAGHWLLPIRVKILGREIAAELGSK